MNKIYHLDQGMEDTKNTPLYTWYILFHLSRHSAQAPPMNLASLMSCWSRRSLPTLLILWFYVAHSLLSFFTVGKARFNDNVGMHKSLSFHLLPPDVRQLPHTKEKDDHRDLTGRSWWTPMSQHFALYLLHLWVACPLLTEAIMALKYLLVVLIW